MQTIMLLSGFLTHFKLYRIQSFDNSTLPIRMLFKNDAIVWASSNWRTKLSIKETNITLMLILNNHSINSRLPNSTINGVLFFFFFTNIEHIYLSNSQHFIIQCF